MTSQLSSTEINLARLSGAMQAETDKHWSACGETNGKLRRVWLEGWIMRMVSKHGKKLNDLSMFHMRRDEAEWLPIETELIEVGRRWMTPKVSPDTLSILVGRTPLAVRIHSSRKKLGAEPLKIKGKA